MYRSCALAVLVLGTCWMTALAQGGGGDPDAKGTVSITVEVKNGVTTVTATRAASQGWTTGGVTIFGIDPNGGYIYYQLVPFTSKNPNTGSVELPLPNGTFDVWAAHTVVENSPGTGNQTVASALSSVTVANSVSPAVTPGGSITCVPVRVSGGAGFQASGSYSYLTGWGDEPDNKWVYFDAMPTGGGVIRRLGVKDSLDGTWKTAPSTLYVPSQLKYNCWASRAIAKPNGPGQAIGSAWQKDK
ncbi:MAG TPA: hypothetical protein VFG68_08980 [Fimbriiglobus sp.]|nr:hypothetical protein [Fimbriiglobus sp.]